MGCLVCSKTRPVSQCTESLVIGTIAFINTAVFVYLLDVTTGKLYRQSVTTNGSGQVILDKTKPSVYFYSPDHFYECWVTLATANSQDDAELITISSEEKYCLNLFFDKPVNNSNESIVIASETLYLQ